MKLLAEMVAVNEKCLKDSKRFNLSFYTCCTRIDVTRDGECEIRISKSINWVTV